MTKLTKILAMLLFVATSSFANWLGGTSEPENTKKIDGKVFYQITTPEELAWFAVQVNSGKSTINAQLANDIVLWDTEVTDKSGTTRWKAIGDTSTRAFDGIFDGNGHKISGLYVNDTLAAKADSISRGLFGVVGENGVVKNLSVDNAYVYAHVDSTKSKKRYGNIGGLVGKNKGTIENVSYDGTVLTYLNGYYSSSTYYAYGYVGGIAGYNTGSVKGATVSGSVKHSVGSNYVSYVGGVVGYEAGGKFIENSKNKADVFGQYSGGVAGYVNAAATIGNCSNSGAVSGSSSGGIAGYVYAAATISNCTNSGAVSGSSSGGIAGDVNAAATISNCTNSGAVSGSSSSGGIAGDVNAAATISNCTNSGAVTASGSSSYSYSGGIAGYVYAAATISNCSNSGSVTATTTSSSYDDSYSGGIVGFFINSKGLVSTCVNLGKVFSSTKYTGTSTNTNSTLFRIAYAGGIAGYSASQITDSHNLADVEAVATSAVKYYANKYYVGGIVGYTSGIVQNVYSAAENIVGTATGGNGNVARRGALFGLIASGASTKNAYFDTKVADLSAAVGVDSSSANTVNVGGLSTANMQRDQFAWQLNTMASSQENSKIWSRANGYPIFADANNLPTMRVTFDDDGASTRKYTNNKGIVSMPDDPEPASGYKFVSWVKENGDVFTGKQKVSADMTVSALYASSAEQKYVVSFEYPEDNEIAALVTGADGLLESIPEAPAAEEGYYFKGWFDENLTRVDSKTVFTENTTVKALYGELLDLSYTVTFKNVDGTVLQSSAVQYGNVPVYAGDAPTLAATAQYTYTFAGWDATLIPVTEEVVYTATYDATINKYTVQFLNYDNSVLQEELLAYGTMPAYKGENPERESTVAFNYTFKGFDKTIASVVGDATYIAEFDATPVTYEVVFKNGSEILKTQYVEYGKAATAPASPTREGYVFNGWDKSFSSVKSALTVNALFTAAPKHQLIVYVDGKVEISEDVYEGASYTLPEAAEKPGYTFVGWYDNKGNYLGQPGESITISADISIEARYSTVSYTITFVDEDGSVIESGSVEYGSMPTAPKDPTKASTAQYTYEFAGWTPEITTVKGNAVYTATYNAVVRNYTVTFADENGKALSSSSVAYGKMPTAPATEPTKAATAQYNYTFAGWTPELVKVTDDATYKATFTSTLRNYTITFVDEDGVEISKSTVAYGKTPSAPADPSKASTAQYSYEFAGWSPAVTAVSSNTTYTATYTSKVRTYEIAFVDEDGSEISKSTVAYGKTPVAPADPTKASTAQYIYEFAGWTPEITTVKGKATYSATYNAVAKSYTVTFVDEDGTEISKSTVAYGKTPVAPADPTKASTAQYSYEFAGWTPGIVKVIGDATYKASYNSVLNAYKVTFLDYDGSTLKSQNVKFGAAATAPAEPERDGYKFTGWDKSFDEIVKNTDVTAQYEKLSSSSVQNSSSSSSSAPKSSSSSEKSDNSSSSAKHESSSSEKGDAIIEIAGVPHFSVEIVGRNVQISAARIGSAYMVLDMQGRVLNQGHVNVDNFNVAVPRAGNYLIRIGNQTRNIVVH
ncbi:InlB B-repeat-containing protein [Hallerella succinigenes]|uniref:Putative repeat protein (TIGR02543 family) n=1 Tax=Hallerella succinigenes TaxID=1896222 RepID=A0A2M9AAU3_9BACT|nr:InlB B-repeat-containing protein [Hallerella succinigenes]PJJ42733.1 putative repeat protein (TIGR02543 family) [Hallerella succinigenes]